MVLGQLPTGDNSPPDKNKAQLCPPGPLSSRQHPTTTTPHQIRIKRSYCPPGPLSSRPVKPCIRTNTCTVGSCPDTPKDTQKYYIFIYAGSAQTVGLTPWFFTIPLSGPQIKSSHDSLDKAMDSKPSVTSFKFTCRGRCARRQGTCILVPSERTSNLSPQAVYPWSRLFQ